MAKLFNTVVRFEPIATLPLAGVSVAGDTCVLDSNGHLYTFDGVGWVDNGSVASGSGTSARAFLTPPNGSRAQYTQNVVIPSMTSTSNVFTSLVANNDYDADELEDLRVRVQANNGSADFTVFRDGPLGGTITVAYTVI